MVKSATEDEPRLSALTTRLIDADTDAPSRPRPQPGSDGAAATAAPAAPPPPALPLRKILAVGGVAPVAVMALLNMVDLFERSAFSVLSPDIQRSFGLSKSALGAMAGLGGLVIVAAGVPIAMLADRHPRRRTLIAGAAAAVWACFSVATGLASQLWQLLGARTMTGIGQASVEPVHGSLLSDFYPVEGRTRVLSVHTWGAIVGMTAGPVTAGAIAKLAGGPDGWRVVFIVTACMTVIPALWVLRIKSPISGQAERARVLGAAAAKANDEQAGPPRIGFSTAVQRLLRIKTVYALLVAFGVYGFTAVSAPVLLNLWFDHRWHMDQFQRGLVATIIAAVGLVAIPAGGIIGDRLAHRHPGWPLVLLGLAAASHSIIFTTALYMPSIVLVVGLIGLSEVPILLVVVSARTVLSRVAPPELRSLAFTLIPLATLLIGGLLGGAVLGAVADQTGERFALTLLLPIGVAAGILMVRGARFTEDDIAAVDEEILEEANEKARLRSGGTPELLQVRNLDFSYGQVQILFDVNLDIHEGEILALLGTNGAGKSTLLSLVSGLSHPDRGIIRYQGANITYLETERIVRLGIEQVPGGRAVFPGLTVRENLLVATRMDGRKGTPLTDVWEEPLSFFPALVARMNQPAGTLSGGEQQMLALAKAFVNRPKLLLIDELSLGLAPAVVGALMNVIRQMNASGTTILIVEQSVNVALSIADRAIFMEKGQVRFEGAAEDLRGRRDLLRSVFLGGAVKGEG
jgi:ABC-type branched-subunit amino acid transport system ATPase component/predicted MFS family arabinose efflux permease